MWSIAGFEPGEAFFWAGILPLGWIVEGGPKLGIYIYMYNIYTFFFFELIVYLFIFIFLAVEAGLL